MRCLVVGKEHLKKKYYTLFFNIFNPYKFLYVFYFFELQYAVLISSPKAEYFSELFDT